jgi:hypothetical protein
MTGGLPPSNALHYFRGGVMKTALLVAELGLGLGLMAASGCANRGQRPGETPGEYMSMNSTGPGSEMRIDGKGRIFGANVDMVVTPTGYRGILAGALTMMESEDGERITGSRDGRPIDMHFTFDGVTIRASGLFAGRMGRIQIDSTAISSSVGRCGFDLARQQGLYFVGQRGCNDGSIAPAALELPPTFVRLPIHRKVMLLAALLYV